MRNRHHVCSGSSVRRPNRLENSYVHMHMGTLFAQPGSQEPCLAVCSGKQHLTTPNTLRPDGSISTVRARARRKEASQRTQQPLPIHLTGASEKRLVQAINEMKAWALTTPRRQTYKAYLVNQVKDCLHRATTSVDDHWEQVEQQREDDEE